MRILSSSFPFLMCMALMASACVPVAGASPTGTPVTVSVSQEQGLEMKLDEYLTRLTALGFHGAVLIARNGDILLSKGYGALDENGSASITPETLFAIGSNTKPFTAAAILKLQDQGSLNVKDTIGRFFADVPSDKSGITIHQLLTHSSGLDHSGVFNGDFERVSRDDAVARILKSHLLFPPGEETSYSDYGFILLAAIVEMASGTSYQDYLRTAIFEPAVMAHTGWWGDDPVLKSQPSATGFVDGKSKGTLKNLPGPFWGLMGAGGIVSSVDDLYRWHVAMQQGKILSKEALEAYSTVQFPVDERGGEGYGWLLVKDRFGHRVRAHAGGTPQVAHNNVMQWYIDDDLLFIASSSNDDIRAENVLPNLVKIVFGRPYPLPPKTITVESSVLDRYIGTYQIAEANTITVTRTGDKLLLTGEGPQAFDMLFPPDPRIDVQAAQIAVVNYLNSQRDAQLNQWKNRVSSQLGSFKQFHVVGTAPPNGNGEPWTYVSFEFAGGEKLTRWIVSPAGAMEAALLETEPPYMTFLPESETQFVPFSLNTQPPIQEVVFSLSESGTPKMMISIPTGQLDATKLSS